MGKIAMLLGILILILVIIGWQWGAFVVFWITGGVILAGFFMGVWNEIKGK